MSPRIAHNRGANSPQGGRRVGGAIRGGPVAASGIAGEFMYL